MTRFDFKISSSYVASLKYNNVFCFIMLASAYLRVGWRGDRPPTNFFSPPSVAYYAMGKEPLNYAYDINLPATSMFFRYSPVCLSTVVNIEITLVFFSFWIFTVVLVKIYVYIYFLHFFVFITPNSWNRQNHYLTEKPEGR